MADSVTINSTQCVIATGAGGFICIALQAGVQAVRHDRFRPPGEPIKYHPTTRLAIYIR